MEVRKGSDQPWAPGTQGEPTTITRLCHPPLLLSLPPTPGSRPISDLSSLGPLAACEANQLSSSFHVAPIPHALF